ncbi:restriction endonuclease subunit S [Pseudidiomarina sp. 1ASP75-14]|uniref:restriction endonuclease subunit S n=1 Tax=Pseudidiomarina terrestris TaxID=2820060 RepID=UPI002652E988|nr:restriction endonuclease subunit S [Pseudidiomarina sp. 1ASP75-14]MDN7137890.1 restriction endonuclease subunit S [Pseudidiomarina sp. 1ASP75-14]
MKLPSYEEYSATGSWLGEIPTHWFNSKLKYIAGFTTGLTPPTSDSSNYDSKEKPWFRPEDLSEKGSLEINASKKISASAWKKLRQIPVGSTLLCCIGSIGKLGYLMRAATSNQQITAVTPKFDIVNPKLIFWILAASQRELKSLSMGNVVKILNSDRLGELRVPLPPNNEQQKIAQFLDYETAKIDALIDEQKRLIELLKEKRQAVISHAVTKGLNPDAPMKDSGVEWLGQIPEHWETTPIKHVTKTFEQGWSPQCFNEPVSNESELGVLKVGCVKQGRFDYSENKRLPPELKFKSELAVKAGDLLISRANTRELVGSAGVPTVNHDNLMISDKLFRLKLTGQAISRFVCFFLTTKAARKQIELAATGASDSMLNIGQGTIREMPFPCPPVEEQRQIVDYVVRVNWRLLELAGEALKLVNTLKERRSALISAAVTGKIDVRDWQPPAGSDTVDSNTSMQTERHYG